MAAVFVVIGASLAWWRGWVHEFFGGRPPSTTGTPAGPGVSRKVAWGDVVDPLGDCRFVEKDGRLTIEVPGGPKQHDLNAEPGRSDLNAPRVLREVEGDFDARVTIADWTPGGPLTSRTRWPYVAAGLVVWQDESHFLRLFRTTDPAAQTEFHPGWTCTDVDLFWGAGESHHVRWDNLTGIAHLRIRRVNGVLFVAQSSNGQNWINEAPASDFSCTGPVRVGVVAISTVFQDYTPEFKGFEVNGVPPSPRLPNAPPLFFAPFSDVDVRRIAALPAAEQVAEVRKELMRRNPGFDGKMEHKIEDGVVTELRINAQQVTDISPIRVFDALRVLRCIGIASRGEAPLADLTPLKGMKLAGLTELTLSYTKVGDSGLAPFKDCKHLTSLDLCYAVVTDDGLAHLEDCKNLTFLQLGATGISDAGLAHFKDCKSLTLLHLNLNQVTNAGLAYFKDCKNLMDLGLGLTQVTDAGLAYFEGCKNLTHLNLFGTNVSNVGLAHFKDCKNLTTLNIEGTKVTDLSLLKEKPLKEFWCDFQPERDAEILRAIKTLQKINGKPAEEFWKSVEKR